MERKIFWVIYIIALIVLIIASIWTFNISRSMKNEEDKNRANTLYWIAIVSGVVSAALLIYGGYQIYTSYGNEIKVYGENVRQSLFPSSRSSIGAK